LNGAQQIIMVILKQIITTRMISGIAGMRLVTMLPVIKN
jgi:hypothetical protein